MSANASLERLSLGTIRCVREVLAFKSVTLAAERLGITQPAVSQQVARFEKLSGIPIIARHGNNLTVRSDAVAALITAIVEAEDTLRHIARGEDGSKPRLGMCDCFAAYHCHSIDRYLELGREFDIHVGRPSGLAEMFARGELDVVVRPLFHHEGDLDLTIDVPLIWVAASEPWTGGGGDPAEPVPVILETNLSPYSYYAERLLEEAHVPYKIVARVDDHLVRSHFVAAGLGCTAIPKFLMRSLPAATRAVARIPKTNRVRFGLSHNKKSIPYKHASDIFETFAEQLAA